MNSKVHVLSKEKTFSFDVNYNIAQLWSKPNNEFKNPFPYNPLVKTIGQDPQILGVCLLAG